MHTIKMFNLTISEPIYTQHNYKNSLGKAELTSKETMNPFIRTAQTALPFICLYAPAKQPIALFLRVSRLWNQKEMGTTPQALFQTAISVASVACTIFAPPLAILIDTGQDLIKHSTQLIEALKKRDYQEALVLGAEILNDSLYLCLCFTGASEIVIASLSLQVLLGLHHSYKEFTDKNYIEAFGHLIMAAIRGHQLKLEIKVMQLQRSIDEHIAQVKRNALPEKQKMENEIPKSLENRVTLWVTSPYDPNGALQQQNKIIFETNNTKREIVKIEAKNLDEVQKTINEINFKGQKIENIIFHCHATPVAIKPTNFIIKIPDHPEFNTDQYFLNFSSMRRIPEATEYESFDRFANIIKNAIIPNGKIVLHGCSTAVDTNHPEKNFAVALAKRLPEHKVIGTTKKMKAYMTYLSDGENPLVGSKLKLII